MHTLVKYLQGDSLKGLEVSLLSSYLMWFEVPTPAQISKIIVEGELEIRNNYNTLV